MIQEQALSWGRISANLSEKVTSGSSFLGGGPFPEGPSSLFILVLFSFGGMIFLENLVGGLGLGWGVTEEM